jgi:hypothetical protein
MSDRPEPDPRTLIGGQYAVDVTHRLPDAGGGIPAFSVTSRRPTGTSLMALRVDRHAPARPRALNSFATGVEGLLTPLAHGGGPSVDGQPGWYVVCQAPLGQPLSDGLRPWPEPALIDHVLRPIAMVLEELQSRGLTHRGIRPNNVFRGAAAGPVTLGAVWAAPPAMHQPAVYETVYTALCHPAARGEGRTADDVYALGVLLVTLALGRIPMDGLDHATILARKLELGDFAAVTNNERLPPMLSDIVRGMLTDDPEHRPSPALLRDPAGARGRRVSGRPPPRAQRSFKIGALTIWNGRNLALAMALDPAEALAAIQSGTLMYWLRRGLGDSNLAVKLEELVRQQALDLAGDKEIANAMLVMRAISDADFFMPLCWRGIAIFPDGLGTALAAAITTTSPGSDLQRKLSEIVQTEAEGAWAAMREDHVPSGPQRLEARQRRAIFQIKGPAGGLPRLAYTLNPLIPCASPLLASGWVATVSELATALDAIAAAAPAADLLDPHIAAFIGARSERALDQEVKALGETGDATDRAYDTLRLFSELQVRYHPGPLRGLTTWVAARAQPLVERWKNRERRAAVEAQVKTLTAAGILRPILVLLADHEGHAADVAGMREAISDLAVLDAQLRDIADGGGRRAGVAARLGQEIAAGLGLAAIAATLILAAMG